MRAAGFPEARERGRDEALSTHGGAMAVVRRLSDDEGRACQGMPQEGSGESLSTQGEVSFIIRY